MKNRIILLLLLVCQVSFAASTFTTNYNLEKSADGDTAWGSAYRSNMDTIDSTMYSTATDILNHTSDTVDAHDASAISATSGALCTTEDTVQEFLDCLDSNYSAIIGGTAVTTNTTQTITGAKTFTGGLTTTDLTVSSFTSGICHVSGGGVFSSSAIVNADIDASADIARSKLAAGTADHVLINNGSGAISSEAQLSGTRGGTGASNAGILTYGANNITVTTSGVTTITLPTSGTMATLAGTEDLSNKTFTTAVKLKETGGGSDTVDLQAGAASASYTITMPLAAPTANTALAYDGANYVWSSAGGWTTYANENISASGSITSSTTVGQQYRRVTGNAAAVTASTTPFGAGGGWNDGIVVQLIGQSNTDTVRITHNDGAKGAILNGDCVLGQYDTLTLQYDSTADRWIEIARSMK